MARPITTLFMLMSVDGKISPGITDELDFDKDLPLIPGVKEGLQQYYDIEQTTDLWALNSGRVQAKMGVNEMPLPGKTPVSFVLIDNHHLTEQGIRYFCAWSKEFVLVTSNKTHPAYQVEEPAYYLSGQAGSERYVTEIKRGFWLRASYDPDRRHTEWNVSAGEVI